VPVPADSPKALPPASQPVPGQPVLPGVRVLQARVVQGRRVLVEQRVRAVQPGYQRCRRREPV